MKTLVSEIMSSSSQKESEFIQFLIDRGGPEIHDYQKFTSIVNSLEPNEIDCFREKIHAILNENTLIGRGFVKPYGYPGDFTLIDKIYQFEVSNDIRFKKWDLFFQNQPGANAVRNRKDSFIEYCKNLTEKKNNAKVLILGSGPASDVYEFLNDYSGGNDISFDLVDYDQAAIDFSIKKTMRFSGQITYNKINALRFNSYKLYDLIWSAGMFDYFKDKHFTFLIRKYSNCLTEEGEMVISNFSTRNPTRKLMEVLSDWHLNHRTESDLFRVASDAFIDKELVSIEKESLGINLFLKIRKN